MKRIGILQPGYLPWLGFFEQVHKSDLFVLYDDVQYDKEGWRNRNRIKTAQGVQWLTVPVLVRFSDHPLIKDVHIDNKTNWAKKHLSSIEQNYTKAPFFKNYIPVFREAYSKKWELLIDIDLYFILKFMEILGLDTNRLVRSSSLGMNTITQPAHRDKISRLIALCKHCGASIFYEGASGRSYIDDRVFAGEGITVEYQDYIHPVYSQIHGEFTPYLSILDLLFNHGEESLKILLNQLTVCDVINRHTGGGLV
jgi:hypothetical protein